MGRVVIFGIRAKHQPKVCDEFSLSPNLDDRTSKRSLTSSGNLGLTRSLASWVDEDVGLNGSPTSDVNVVVIRVYKRY